MYTHQFVVPAHQAIGPINNRGNSKDVQAWGYMSCSFTFLHIFASIEVHSKRCWHKNNQIQLVR